jgi:hypothetical protein
VIGLDARSHLSENDVIEVYIEATSLSPTPSEGVGGRCERTRKGIE